MSRDFTARIRSSRHVEAMAALDTVELLAKRVENLLKHGRRIAMTQRYTWTNTPPELAVGLEVADTRLWKQDNPLGVGFVVRLKPGARLINVFGFSAHAYEGNATEAEAWARYKAHKADSNLFSERRRWMTCVQIEGGLDGDGPARDDHIVIQHWNDDGVCDERVIAFDYGKDHDRG